MEDIWLVVKVIYIVFLVVYVLFSLVVARQVRSMTNTLEVGFEGFLNALALVHVLAAIGITAAAVLFL